MATIALNGTPTSTFGDLPEAGADAPDAVLAGRDLSDVRISDYSGRRTVLNIFPSLDTPVCAASVRRFNQAAAARQDATVLCISADLPFAMDRFCEVEGLTEVVPLSAFRSPGFGRDYGVLITDGPMAGLLARAVVVVSPDGIVQYSQMVGDVTEEPDYDAALEALDRIGRVER